MRFTPWMHAHIGGLANKDLLATLTAEGFLVGPWAMGMLKQESFPATLAVENVELFRVQVRDLGFKQEPFTPQVLDRIRELGYALCEAEAGPHIRRACADQAAGDYFWVAMDPIVEGPSKRVFFIGRSDDGTRWLRGYAANNDFRWVLDAEFVFRKPKSS